MCAVAPISTQSLSDSICEVLNGPEFVQLAIRDCRMGRWVRQWQKPGIVLELCAISGLVHKSPSGHLDAEFCPHEDSSLSKDRESRILAE